MAVEGQFPVYRKAQQLDFFGCPDGFPVHAQEWDIKFELVCENKSVCFVGCEFKFVFDIPPVHMCQKYGLPPPESLRWLADVIIYSDELRYSSIGAAGRRPTRRANRTNKAMPHPLLVRIQANRKLQIVPYKIPVVSTRTVGEASSLNRNFVVM